MDPGAKGGDEAAPPPAGSAASGATCGATCGAMSGAMSGGPVLLSARPRDLLMVSLSRFYSEPSNMSQVLSYITCASGVSLRLIDWFVTNYAKRHNVVIRRSNRAHFNVYLSYRAQLKAYSKQLFDPFRRRDRIIFHYTPERSIETTIGQLNFFRWMLENGVLDYVVMHADEIEQDMLHAQRGDDGADCCGAGPERAPPVHIHAMDALAAGSYTCGSCDLDAQAVVPTAPPLPHRPSASSAPTSKHLLVDPGSESETDSRSDSNGGFPHAPPTTDDGTAKGASKLLCKASRNMTRITGTRMLEFD